MFLTTLSKLHCLALSSYQDINLSEKHSNDALLSSLTLNSLFNNLHLVFFIFNALFNLLHDTFTRVLFLYLLLNVSLWSALSLSNLLDGVELLVADRHLRLLPESGQLLPLPAPHDHLLELLEVQVTVPVQVTLGPHHLDLSVGEGRPVRHPPELQLTQLTVTVLE